MAKPRIWLSLEKEANVNLVLQRITLLSGMGPLFIPPAVYDKLPIAGVL